MDILAFYAIAIESLEIQKLSTPQNDRLNLSFFEDMYVYAKKMARKDRKMVIYEQQILGLTLYLVYFFYILPVGLTEPSGFDFAIFSLAKIKQV